MAGRRLPLLAISLVLLAAAAFLAAGRSEAHALLVRADPPANSQLREPPSVMTLYFTEALERRISTVRVFDADGRRFDTGVEFDDRDEALMRVRLERMPPGYYTVAWETLSKVDGHRITGSYPITVLNPDGSIPPGSPTLETMGTPGGSGDLWRVVAKGLLLVSGALLSGALAFAALTGGVPGAGVGEARKAAVSRALIVAGASLAVLALAGVLELVLRARDLGLDIGAVVSDTRWGERWLIRNAFLLPPLAASLAMAWLVHRRGREAPFLFLPALGLAAAYLAVTATVSHSAAGVGAFWGTLSDFVHLVAASVWVGMLFQLVLLFIWSRRNLEPQGRPLVIAAGLQRFSLAAVVSVALLLFTGVANSLIALNEVGDLLATGYGRVLLLKLLLVLPVLAVGGANAYLFRPEVLVAAEAGGPRSASQTQAWESLERTMTRAVRWEAGLGLAILVVAALLTQTPPARGALSAPAEREGQFIETRDAGNLSVTLVIDPGRPGNNVFEVYLAGAVETVERVRLNFERQRGDPFPAQLVLEPSNFPTFYIGEGPFLGVEGRWRVTVDLQVSAGSDLLVHFPVALGTSVGARQGGAFEAPRTMTVSVAALLAASAALSLAIVIGSLPTESRPFGLLGDAFQLVADTLETVRLRPGLSLAGLIIVGVGLGIVLGSHAHNVLTREEAQRGNPVPATQASIDRGRMLFIQNCIQCHGETGRGDGPLAASLPLPPANLYDHVPYHPDLFFFSVITNGLSGYMPAFGSVISEEDRWNIVNFLRDQFGQPAAAE